MCVRFEFGTILKYAFSFSEELEPDYLISDNQISQFLTVLDEEIRKHKNESTHYKYVYFDWDDATINEFLDSHQDVFLSGGSDYLLIGELPTDTAENIEEHYKDPVVTEALRIARTSIRLPRMSRQSDTSDESKQTQEYAGV